MLFYHSSQFLRHGGIEKFTHAHTKCKGKKKRVSEKERKNGHLTE